MSPDVDTIKYDQKDLRPAENKPNTIKYHVGSGK
jgi:hypothetical protein